MCFKGVLRKIQGCFNGVLSGFQVYLKEVLLKSVGQIDPSH